MPLGLLSLPLQAKLLGGTKRFFGGVQNTKYPQKLKFLQILLEILKQGLYKILFFVFRGAGGGVKRGDLFSVV
jgi:hypothetical protein